MRVAPDHRDGGGRQRVAQPLRCGNPRSDLGRPTRATPLAYKNPRLAAGIVVPQWPPALAAPAPAPNGGLASHRKAMIARKVQPNR